MKAGIRIAIFGIGLSFLSAPCNAQQWNPLEGVIANDANAVGGFLARGRNWLQPIPFNTGGVPSPPPTVAPVSTAVPNNPFGSPSAPVLQQGRIYQPPNYTQQTIQHEIATFQAGGVGGLNQHPIPPAPAPLYTHTPNYVAPHPAFVQVPHR